MKRYKQANGQAGKWASRQMGKRASVTCLLSPASAVFSRDSDFLLRQQLSLGEAAITYCFLTSKKLHYYIH